MPFSAEEVRTALSIGAIAVSLVSVYLTRRLWLQSNRPIVTAYLDEYEPGSMATAFNLVIANTGNRPAVDITLHARPADVDRLLDLDAPSDRRAELVACFSPRSSVTLLHNGENLETSFGAFCANATNGKWLNYGAQIPIIVKYRDLEGRRYKSALLLKVYARKGFAGRVWN